MENFNITEMLSLAGVLLALFGSIITIFIKVSNNLSTTVKNSNADLKSHVDTTLSIYKQESKADIDALDGRVQKNFQQLYDRMDTSSNELKELIYRETSILTKKNQDQDREISQVKDRMHKYNEDLLNFKLVVSEQYEKKS